MAGCCAHGHEPSCSIKCGTSENISITRSINLHGVNYSDIIVSPQIIVISAGIFISSACLLCCDLPLVCYEAQLNGSEYNVLFSDIIGVENTSDKKMAQVEGSIDLSTSERHVKIMSKRSLLGGVNLHIINVKYNHISYRES
jgi:hypothetical protein